MSSLRGRCYFLMLLALLASLCSAQGTTSKATIKQEDDEIGLSYEFVWGSEITFGAFMPLRIEIENPLKNDRGILTIKNGSYESKVPVELPSQTIRSLIVYIPGVNYGDPEIYLSCDQTNIRVPLSMIGANYQGGHAIGLISDVSSLMSFIRAAPIRLRSESGTSKEISNEVINVQDVFSLPGKAPDRAIGYDGLDLVVLGEGAERMTDIEVLAIQKYVLGGGRVLFYGGAVSPILRDPRWADFVPGSNPVVARINDSEVLSRIIRQQVKGEIAVTGLTPDPGTFVRMEQNIALTISKQIGLGESIYWAFDPFVSPIRDVKDRKNLFGQILADDSLKDKDFLSSMSALSSGELGYGYGYGYGYYPGMNMEPEGAFKVTMPKTFTIFLILVSYFIVVVPLNFFFLARINKGHFAWVTAPLIGLCFASIFFFIARGLYQNTLSRATDAVLAAHQNLEHAYVFGRQKTFFPRGGRYDLGLKGVESLTSSSLFGYSGFGEKVDTGFAKDIYDVGEVIAPNASVSNLAYREVFFRQAVKFNFQFPLDIKESKFKNSYSITGTLFNDSPYPLSETKLYVGGMIARLSDIKPGETVSFNERMTLMEVPVENYDPFMDAQKLDPTFSNQFSGVALVARAKGLEVGTSLGKEEGKPPLIVFTYSGIEGINR